VHIGYTRTQILESYENSTILEMGKLPMWAASFILSHGFLEAGEDGGGGGGYIAFFRLHSGTKIIKNISAPWLVQHFRLE
jgi:hypothetical protein